MWKILLFVLLTVGCETKRFVLLDPDDSNLEKSAANITDADIRSRSLKMAKFRKWLKYDVDCEFISRDDLELKISQGRCPFEAKKEQMSTTTTKKPKSLFFKRKRKPVTKTDRSLFSHENKENVVRAVVGSSKMQDIDLTPLTSPEMELVSGSMITLLCDEKHREDARKKKKKRAELEFIEWFVNGKRVKPSWFDWRVSVSRDGKLGIWPIGEHDSGHFECLSNGQLTASVTIRVVPMSKVLLDGLLNYLFVCGIFAVATVSMGCLLGSRNQEKKHFEVDRMEEFLAENVFKTDQMAKEKVANILEKQGVIDERQIIEKKATGNRSTIMILLQNPELKKMKQSAQPAKDKTSASEGGAVGTVTTATTEAATTGAETVAETGVETGAGATTITTNETEKTKKTTENEETSEEEDEEEDGDVATSTGSKASKGSTTTGKSKDGKKKKKVGKGKKTKKKKEKGKKKVSKAGKSKTKGGGAKKKTVQKKPAKKKK